MKYNNKKTVYNDMKFDSKRELMWWQIFEQLEEIGMITDLRRQVKYELQPEFIDADGNKNRSINYIADIVYFDNIGNEHYVDVKGVRTDTFKIKKKMFQYRYNKILEEVI